jgi:hypothetical protein
MLHITCYGANRCALRSNHFPGVFLGTNQKISESLPSCLLSRAPAMWIIFNRAFNKPSSWRENRDQILMARAKIVQCAVQLAQSEEQLGEAPDIALHANLAIRYAEEAIELALRTQNKHLLAEAYIARGSAADDYLQDWELAKEYAANGAALLGQDDRDHLYKELGGGLKLKIMGSAGIDETLRLWSTGQLGSKIFQADTGRVRRVSNP